MAGRESLYTTAALGLVFVALGSCRVLLIKFSSDEDGKYSYLPVTVNVCAEMIKLVVCSVLAFQAFCSSGHHWHEAICLSRQDLLQLLKWAVPGFLYFCDNLLAFFVIRYFQPAIVVLLGNFVIVTTSILFRLILKRPLSRVQWASLVILFLAIVSLSNQSSSSVTIDHHKHHAVNHLVVHGNISLASLLASPTDTPEEMCLPEDTQYQLKNTSSSLESALVGSFRGQSIDHQSFTQIRLHEGHILILLQCVVSSLANIYNEKIFKEGTGLKESIYIQNSKLYMFGVLFNLLSLVIHGVYRHKVLHCGFFYGHNAYSLILIFVTACYGLNVAFILKFRDNMFHLMSSQLISVIVISASVYFFGFKPKLEFFLTAPIVLLVIYIFHMSKEKDRRPADIAMYPCRLRRDPSDQRGGDHPERSLIISPDNLQE